MIRVQVKLFGAFRKFIPPGEQDNAVTVELAGPVTVRDLRVSLAESLKALGTGFHDSTLINESALASEEAILDEQTVIHANTSLAILPPVCGG